MIAIAKARRLVKGRKSARFDVERRVLGISNAGLVELFLAAEHGAGKDQRLRFGARLGEAALDQQYIQTLLFARQGAAPFPVLALAKIVRLCCGDENANGGDGDRAGPH